MKEYKTKEQKKRFYNSSVWIGKNGLRQRALKRDNYECKMCAGEGRVHVDSQRSEGERKTIELNVHHIKEIETHPHLATTLSNLTTICIRHHNLVHDRYQPAKPSFVNEERW